MAKEACRKLYLQVKTLDREKSALEALSQSLSEENTSLKKLNESFVKNIDTPCSGILLYFAVYFLIPFCQRALVGLHYRKAQL